MAKENSKLAFYLTGMSLLALMGCWSYALLNAPMDAQQGMVYKIIFVHVPMAACALGVSSLGMLIASIWGLVSTKEEALRAGKAWVETGLIFTGLTLATGSIWGKPTWGTWWTWDARLTTTLLLAILQLAYLILLESLASGRQRIRVLSILGLIIFIDVPVIYKSVEWWRTLHQPASLIEKRGQTMDPEMLHILLLCLAAAAIFNVFLWWTRFINLGLKANLDDQTYASLKG